jgi:Glycine/D-amino acid oxidases (deaminating)
MTLSIWLDDKAQAPKEYGTEQFDVAIIGGGIMGAATAYQLSRRDPSLKIAIIEAGKLASAATGRSAGFVLRGIQKYYAEAIREYGRETARYICGFTEENQRMIRAFAEKHGNSFELEECGSYTLAASIDELEELAASAQLLSEDGFAVEYHKEDPIDRDFYGAMCNRADLGINPVKLVNALVDASGAIVYEEEYVRKFNAGSSSSRSLTVKTTGRVIECDRCFLTTNAHSALLDPYFLDKITIYRGQILVTRKLNKVLVDRLCYANYGWVYFRQLADRRFMLGGRRHLFLNEEEGLADMITKPVQTALQAYLKELFPELAGIGIDYRFSGPMAFTKDGLPLVGEHPHVPGVYFAVAFSGHGLGYGLNMAKLLTEVALDGAEPGVFSVNRSTLKEPGHAEAKEVS